MMGQIVGRDFLDDVDINGQFYTCQRMDLDDRSKEPFRNKSIPMDPILSNLFGMTKP